MLLELVDELSELNGKGTHISVQKTT